MKLLRSVVSFWRSVPRRVDGSRVPDDHDGISRLSVAAPTWIDRGLERKARRYPETPAPPAQRLPEAPPRG